MDRLQELCRDQHIAYEATVPLSDYTTFRIGGSVPAVVSCADVQTFEQVLRLVLTEGRDFILLGEGSNILASDGGLKQIVIRALAQKSVLERFGNSLKVYAGTRLDDVAVGAIEHSLEGLVFASGIPGTFGGAVVGNAGAFGQQMSDCLVEVELMDRSGKCRCVPAEELNFSYRESSLKYSQEIVLSGTIQLREGDRDQLRAEREAILTLRRAKHPDYKKTPSAGSFFKNIMQPDGTRTAAGWLLEEAGCKALAVGDAAVFEGHANIIINRGNAMARDVDSLAKIMRLKVLEKFQIKLEPEVRILGMFD